MEIDAAFFESQADREDNFSNLGGTPETDADDYRDVRSGSVRSVHPLSLFHLNILQDSDSIMDLDSVTPTAITMTLMGEHYQPATGSVNVGVPGLHATTADADVHPLQGRSCRFLLAGPYHSTHCA